MNPTKKNKKELTKSRNGQKIREISVKRGGRLRWEGFTEKVSFESWVEDRSSNT